MVVAAASGVASSVVETVILVLSLVVVADEVVIVDSGASKMEYLNLYKQNTYFDANFMLKEKLNLKL